MYSIRQDHHDAYHIRGELTDEEYEELCDKECKEHEKWEELKSGENLDTLPKIAQQLWEVVHPYGKEHLIDLCRHIQEGNHNDAIIHFHDNMREEGNRGEEGRKPCRLYKKWYRQHYLEPEGGLKRIPKEQEIMEEMLFANNLPQGLPHDIESRGKFVKVVPAKEITLKAETHDDCISMLAALVESHFADYKAKVTGFCPNYPHNNGIVEGWWKVKFGKPFHMSPRNRAAFDKALEKHHWGDGCVVDWWKLPTGNPPHNHVYELEATPNTKEWRRR